MPITICCIASDVYASSPHFSPSFLAEWKAFKIHYRYRETVYHISVLQGLAGEDAVSVTVDGVVQEGTRINLVDDHDEHTVVVGMSS